MSRIGVAVLLAVAASACQGAPPAPERETPEGVLPDPSAGYNLREGNQVFQHYCAPCHGEEGDGHGFNAYSLDPKPRDLTDPAFKAERSDEDLTEIVRIGGGAAGLSTGMPPWGRTLNARQIRNTVLYLRTLRESPE